MKENKKCLMITISILIIAVLYTILVKTVDVASIGPNGSEVGFSTLNRFVRDGLGTSDFWYHVTKYLGIVPFFIVAFYGLQGFIQLVQKKSLKEVDRRLLLLGCLYVLLGITYIFFEKVIINYRPVIMDGELEASYPSSHTMLAMVICLSSLLIGKYYIKNKNLLKGFTFGTIILMLLLVIGRILSGVHWISDILGGIIISITLVSIYVTAIKWQKK